MEDCQPKTATAPRGAGPSKAAVLACLAAANRLSATLLAAQVAGWPVAMSHRGLCWRGRAQGAWQASASVHARLGRDAEQAVVTVAALGSRWPGTPTFPEPPARAPEGRAADLARDIEGAFASIPGPLVVSHAPAHCILASPAVRCVAGQVDGEDVLVVLLERASPGEDGERA